jgi:hypothetical protein
MKERSDGGSVILFRVRVIVVINEVRCRWRCIGHSIYRGTAKRARGEREKERVRVWGVSFGAGAFGLCSVSNLRITIHAWSFVSCYTEMSLFFSMFFFSFSVLFCPFQSASWCDCLCFPSINFVPTFCFPGVLRIRVFMLSSFFLMFSPRGKIK